MKSDELPEKHILTWGSKAILPWDYFTAHSDKSDIFIPFHKNITFIITNKYPCFCS